MARRPSAPLVRSGVGGVAGVAAVLLAACALTACAPTAGEPTDQQPRSVGHVAPTGWHSIGFHGIGLDVPDTVALLDGPWCPGPPPSGDLVVPVFDAGAGGCPAASAPAPSPSPRPRSELTVVLTGSGAPIGLPLTDARTRVLTAAGVTVTASGPTDRVDTVLASARVEPHDANGCEQRIDPAVAPRPLDPDGTQLLPVVTEDVVVCAYGRTATAGDGPTPPPFWLVGSRELPADLAADVDTRLRAAPSVPAGTAVSAAPPGPVLRLLVRGADGNTRVLQTFADVDPQHVTDGGLTVVVDPTAGGDRRPLPTPFDLAEPRE